VAPVVEPESLAAMAATPTQDCSSRCRGCRPVAPVRSTIAAPFVTPTAAPAQDRSLLLGTEPARPTQVTSNPVIRSTSSIPPVPRSAERHRQSHAMRWVHVQRAELYEYGPQATTLLATPLYPIQRWSVLCRRWRNGGTVVLMSRFDVRVISSSRNAIASPTRCWCPWQYQRLMAAPESAARSEFLSHEDVHQRAIRCGVEGNVLARCLVAWSRSTA